MTLTIRLDLDNEAMAYRAEVERCAVEAVKQAMNEPDEAQGTVRDICGNTVGNWTLA